MEATQLLIQDHRRVEQLFQRWESATDDGARKQILDEIVKELSVHAAIEEQFLYPTVRDEVPDGRDMVDEALGEHEEAKEALSELDRMEPSDPRLATRARELMRDVRHHVDEEEGELFPKLRDAVSSDALEEVGEKMERAKAVAPTRPHPRAPSTRPANLATGLAAGVTDRAPDVVTGRGTALETEAETPSRRPAGKATTSKGRTSKAPSAKAKTVATSRKKTSSRSKTQGRSTASRAKASTRPGGTRRGPVYRVTRDKRNGGWKATKQGGSRSLARGDRKDEVVRRARQTARSQKGRLVIHKEDGKIQEERTYGPDPRRSRG